MKKENNAVSGKTFKSKKKNSEKVFFLNSVLTLSVRCLRQMFVE